MLVGKNEILSAVLVYAENKCEGNENLLEVIERELLEYLVKEGMNQREIAQLLKMNWRGVNYRMAMYGLRPIDRKKELGDE